MEKKLEEIKKACEEILSTNNKLVKENPHLQAIEFNAEIQSENIIAEFILKMIKDK